MQFRRREWLIMLATGVFLSWSAGCAEKRDTDVEFVATPQPVVAEMLKTAAVTKDDVVYDLGCGDGRIVITAAKMLGARGVGIDLDAALIGLARKHAEQEGVADRVKFVQGDMFKTDLAEATVVSLYLTPELNVRLRPKLFRELKVGARVVSHDFNMGFWKPDHIGRLPKVKHEYPDATYTRDTPFYCWIIPADVSGRWRWTFTTPAGKREHVLTLAQKFQEVSGELNADGRSRPIGDARLAGDHLSFTYRDEGDPDGSTIWFSGRMSGDAITGGLEIPGGPDKGNYTWTARRSR